jgi:hypothetical protein
MANNYNKTPNELFLEALKKDIGKDGLAKGGIVSGVDNDNTGVQDYNDFKMQEKERMSRENPDEGREMLQEVKQLPTPEKKPLTAKEEESGVLPMIMPKFNTIDTTPTTDAMAARKKALMNLLGR